MREGGVIYWVLQQQGALVFSSFEKGGVSFPAGRPATVLAMTPNITLIEPFGALFIVLLPPLFLFHLMP